MSKAASPRTETLLKVYLGLFAVSVVLCGILAERQLAPLIRLGDGSGVAVTVPREPAHGYGPTINWGGAKR